MSTTLYLLRQPADEIPASVFVVSDDEGDVVALDDAVATSLSSSGKQVYRVGGVGQAAGGIRLTYEELIDRIFAHDHVMVI